ncbi:polysaccharide pyruvyl transferase family protein [Salinimicrobium catena]|uniref:polysaccharide pyruvyl transferase family protein n=1 Tax=Salinimicrobium catena TaxID=390640 RepID=UPI002FE494FB
MKEQYVILTGGKNNAGDHLIKDRAKSLFKWLKPERKIIDFNGWERLSDAQLEEINQSKALLFVGGPALQNKMVPNVYALREKLDEIKVPMATMGIGWYSKKGEWADTYKYKLDIKTLELLTRINNSGIKSSVRDYHTLNVLKSKGFENFIMTGCPALYSKEHIGSTLNKPKKFKRIGYSLGVSPKTSESMFRQMKDVLLLMQEKFPAAEIKTVFHHSPSPKYLESHGANLNLYKFHNRFLNWLQQNNFDHIDISGGATEMHNYYSDIDFHIGYRVHAHILMSSQSKPSILLSEDGRGKALSQVLGGITLDAYEAINESLFMKGLNKFGVRIIDNIAPNHHLVDDLSHTLDYESKTGIKFYQPRVEINRHFEVMKNFIANLP